MRYLTLLQVIRIVIFKPEMIKVGRSGYFMSKNLFLVWIWEITRKGCAKANRVVNRRCRPRQNLACGFEIDHPACLSSSF